MSDTHECKRCDGDYDLRDGHEPTDFCDSCAHDVVAELRDALDAERAKVAARTGDIDTLQALGFDANARAEEAEAKVAKLREVLTAIDADLGPVCHENDCALNTRALVVGPDPVCDCRVGQVLAETAPKS